MAPKEEKFKCLKCGFEYTAMFDIKNVTERSCPQCRSNSVRRLPETKKTS